MLKYVSDVNEETGLCGSVGVGTNTAYYQSIGMVERDVEQAYDGAWYLGGMVPSKPVELAREEKLAELKKQADSFKQNVNNDMMITSSIGYPMNADKRSQDNIRGLIDTLQSCGLQVCSYRCGDNVTRNLSIDQLKVLLLEIITNLQNLYTQKWQYEQKINEAKTTQEVEAIEIKFKMMDFT